MQHNKLSGDLKVQENHWAAGAPPRTPLRDVQRPQPLCWWAFPKNSTPAIGPLGLRLRNFIDPLDLFFGKSHTAWSTCGKVQRTTRDSVGVEGPRDAPLPAKLKACSQHTNVTYWTEPNSMSRTSVALEYNCSKSTEHEPSKFRGSQSSPWLWLVRPMNATCNWVDLLQVS